MVDLWEKPWGQKLVQVLDLRKVEALVVVWVAMWVPWWPSSSRPFPVQNTHSKNSLLLFSLLAFYIFPLQ